LFQFPHSWPQRKTEFNFNFDAKIIAAEKLCDCLEVMREKLSADAQAKGGGDLRKLADSQDFRAESPIFRIGP